MQPLQSYLTKEGWKNDLDQTVERCYKVLPNAEWYSLARCIPITGLSASSVPFWAVPLCTLLEIPLNPVTQQHYALSIFGSVASLLVLKVVGEAAKRRKVEEAAKSDEQEYEQLLLSVAENLPNDSYTKRVERHI